MVSIMKNTIDLYRCDAKEWAELSYKGALLLRIHLAQEAMAHYKRTADAIEEKLHSKEYYALIERFRDSEKAVAWNTSFLEEVS